MLGRLCNSLEIVNLFYEELLPLCSVMHTRKRGLVISSTYDFAFVVLVAFGCVSGSDIDASPSFIFEVAWPIQLAEIYQSYVEELFVLFD